MKFVNVPISKIITSDRLEPKFHVFQETLSLVKEKYWYSTLEDMVSENIIRWQSPKPSTYKDRWQWKHVFIRTADVKKYRINLWTTVYLDDETFVTQKRNRVKGWDLLISVVWNYLGSTAVIPWNITSWAFNDNSARIRLKEWISPYLVMYYLNSKFWQDVIQSLLTRTGQKILSAWNAKQIVVPNITDDGISDKAKSIEENESIAIWLIEEAQKYFYDNLNINFSEMSDEKFFSTNLSDFANDDFWTPAFSRPLYSKVIESIKKYPTLKLWWKDWIATVVAWDEIGSDNYISFRDKTKWDIPFIRTTDFVNYETDLYPDFFVPESIYSGLSQDIEKGDVLFTKDWKIWMVAMITEQDKAIFASGIARIRLKKNIASYITPEYLFLVLTIKEIWKYQANKRTVIASTLPHLRREDLEEFLIPVLDEDKVKHITELISRAFSLKDKNKIIIQELKELMDNKF